MSRIFGCIKTVQFLQTKKTKTSQQIAVQSIFSLKMSRIVQLLTAVCLSGSDFNCFKYRGTPNFPFQAIQLTFFLFDD